MKKYALAFCLLCLFELLKAQSPYYPMLVEGRTWDVFNVPGEMSICPFVNAQHLFLKGDTLLDGIRYEKLYFNLIRSNPPFPFCEGFFVDTTEAYLYPAFFREDTLARKVYMRYPDMEAFVVFDFSLQAGDTLYYPTQSYPIQTVTDWVLTDGSHRKAFKINDWNNNFYVEGIGYLLGAFNQVFEPFEGWNVTTCVRDTSVVRYTTEPDGGPGCILATSDTHNPERPPLKISPNPFFDSFSLELNPDETGKSHEFSMCDWNGRLMVQLALRPQSAAYMFDFPNLPSGAYFWALDGRFGGKVMKH